MNLSKKLADGKRTEPAGTRKAHREFGLVRMAEEVGFEPTVDLRPQQLSRLPRSTTLPLLSLLQSNSGKRISSPTRGREIYAWLSASANFFFLLNRLISDSRLRAKL